MSSFYWDREDKWTSYNGIERINGLYFVFSASVFVEKERKPT